MIYKTIHYSKDRDNYNLTVFIQCKYTQLNANYLYSAVVVAVYCRLQRGKECSSSSYKTTGSCA